MNDMKKIKDILNGFEVPYDHNDWIKLEKDLPKSPGMSGFTKTILVATAVIITVGGIYLLNQFENKKDEIKETITSDSMINNESNNINSNIEPIAENSIISKTNTINTTNTTLKTANDESHQLGSVNSSDNQQESSIKVEKANSENNINLNTQNNTNNNNNNNNSDAIIPNLNNVSFKIEIIETCIPAKVIFTAQNLPTNCELIWNTDENFRVYGNNAEHIYLEEGLYQPDVSIIFNNYVIKTQKLSQISIHKSNEIKINFDNTENLYYFTCNNVEDLRFLWSIDNQQFNEREVNYNFNIAGEYLIALKTINEFGCKSEATEKISIIVEHVYYVPNAFMPNANGVNSSFGPIGEDLDFISYKLVIVDGNGNSVFNSDSPKFMWNGRINNIGEEAKSGFYLWEIKTLDNYGNVQIKKGRVNLIRN